MGLSAISVYDIALHATDAVSGGTLSATSVGGTVKVAIDALGIYALPTPKTISVRASVGAAYNVPLTIRTVAGAPCSVINIINSRAGIAYLVT